MAGLGDGQLYQDRDLLPTDDVRRYAAWLIAAMYGLDIKVLESEVFPGLDAGSASVSSDIAGRLPV